MTTALLTDHYELTMLEASLLSGIAAKQSAFEVFSRTLPPGRRYGVVGGIGRAVEAIYNFRFDPEELEFLERSKVVKSATIDYLSKYRFSGNVWAYQEGELYFPFSPVLRVEARFGEAVLLETVILSILNFDSAVASAGSRMVSAANGRRLIEMGSRRTHEKAAISAARAAYVVGFAATSNLKAGQLYGIPTAGTVAHAFILAHPDEQSAFMAQIRAQGPNTTILVDTYSIESGIRKAVSVAGPSLGAVRIDSGDPATESLRARELLNSLGAKDTRIIISGDLDEYSIKDLSLAPIDSFGVGTRLVTGSGSPTANFVYKLVAIEGHDASKLIPVAKTSVSKATLGGRKTPWRILDPNHKAVLEFLELIDEQNGTDVNSFFGAKTLRPLQNKVISNGEPVLEASLQSIRASHRESLAELNDLAMELSPGDPNLGTVLIGQNGNIVEIGVGNHDQKAGRRQSNQSNPDRRNEFEL